jgi:glycosyltransferase involved in cell wall biosynthesis
VRVVLVVNSLGSGGTERSTAVLLPRLVALGIDPVVAVLVRREVGDEARVRAAGIPVVHLAGGSLPAQARALRALVRDAAPALVHTAIFEADLVGRLGCAGSGVPVLSSLVNTPYDRARRFDPNVRPVKLQAARALDAATAHLLTAHFHAVSEGVARHAVRTLGIPRRRITVVERGRDPGELGRRTPGRRQAARAALGLADDDELVLTAGRQEYQKGHVHLAEALALLARRRPRLRVAIAGREGNATAALQAAIDRTGTADRVMVLGYRDDVADLLCAADLFVLPSIYEGTAGAVLEAWALETPVVASRVTGLEGIVRDRHDAWLVEPRCPAALATAIDRLLGDATLARRLAAAGYDTFVSRFGLDRSAARMADLYRRVAAAR